MKMSSNCALCYMDLVTGLSCGCVCKCWIHLILMPKDTRLGLKFLFLKYFFHLFMIK